MIGIHRIVTVTADSSRRPIEPGMTDAEVNAILRERLAELRQEFHGCLITRSLGADIESALRCIHDEFVACGYDDVRDFGVVVDMEEGRVSIYPKPTRQEIAEREARLQRLEEEAMRREAAGRERSLNQALLEGG